MTSDEAVEQILADFPLQDPLETANLTEEDLAIFQAVLANYIGDKMDDWSFSKEFYDDCINMANHELLNEADAATIIIKEIFRYLENRVYFKKGLRWDPDPSTYIPTTIKALGDSYQEVIREAFPSISESLLDQRARRNEFWTIYGQIIIAIFVVATIAVLLITKTISAEAGLPILSAMSGFAIAKGVASMRSGHSAAPIEIPPPTPEEGKPPIETPPPTTEEKR